MGSVKTQLGVIGGSGIYKIDGVDIAATHKIDTPYGPPSDEVIEARLNGRTVYFLPRHGSQHHLLPSTVNYRANIYAMKSLGVTHLLAVSAVGIMKEEIRPGDLVVPDQIFDRTKGVRPSTFFEDHFVGHVSMADPFSGEMREEILKASKEVGAPVHDGGIYVCMEGPQFSSRAESRFYRATLSPAVIGMTAVPEAALAREAEICYGMLALATDYDCWNEAEEDVSAEAVVSVLRSNGARAQKVVIELAKSLPATSSAPELNAASGALMVHPESMDRDLKSKMKVVFGRYLD